MKMRTLEDLFMGELRDVYDAERQLVKALPKMAKAASSNELRTALEEHLEQTRHQVERLEQVFHRMNVRPRGKSCEAMQGLIAEGKDILESTQTPARDAGIIAAAQKVEHYEIASYGCLVNWARELNQPESAELLKQTLAEEKAADQKLTNLAEARVNVEAREEGKEEGKEEPTREEAREETREAVPV
jgi:ferritin-like metal-binding protein YciE